MRTVALKRYFCLLVVLLFIVPSVTALNSMNQDDNVSPGKDNLEIDNDLEMYALDIHDYIPAGMMSMEVKNALNKYSPEELDESLLKYLARFNTKMLERRERFSYEFPELPYLPLDATKLLGKYDPETGAMISAFPNAELSNDIESFRFDTRPNPVMATGSIAYPASTASTAPSSQSSSGTRGSRAPEEVDLSITQITWNAVNSGWGNYFEIETTGEPPVPAPGDQYSYGGFQVGKTTRFTVTITSQNPTKQATNVKINFSVSEYFSGIPMMRTETKVQTISGVNTQVTFDFVPPFAGDISQFCTVDYVGDPDTSNNGYGWRGLPVFIWSADFESGGTNWGWQKTVDGTTIPNTDAQWTGDRGGPTEYKWHKTNTPANPTKPEHTTTNAWYHGNEPGDNYEDQLPGRNINDRGNGKNNTYLETPRINMGPIIDGQEYLGDLDDNYFYLPYTPMYGAMITGEYEIHTFTQGGVNYWNIMASDWADMRETADSPSGDNWQVKNLAMFGIVYGEYQAFFQGQTDDWNPTLSGFVSGTNLVLQAGYPWELQLGDGSGGSKYGGGVRNWTQNGGPKFRVDFIGDGGGDQNGSGAYFDDFATWGMHDYVVEKRTGFTEFEYPTTNGVPILYEDSTAGFKAKVKNYGKSHQVNVKVEIFEYDHWAPSGSQLGSSVFTQQKSAGTLGKDQESSDVTFAWNSPKEGDYKLFAEVDDYDTDWTPGDNKVEFILHVSPKVSDEIDVLLVDDDDSRGGPGSLTPWSRWNGIYVIDTEFKMMKALTQNDLKFRIYTVGYNETGPDYEIMSEYELVIWLTGLDNEYTAHAWRDNYANTKKVWDVTLKDEDLTQLELFLSDPNMEKKLWLISPGLLYDKYGPILEPKMTANDDFARIYLKIATLRANSTEWNQDFSEITVQGTPNPLEGVAETPMNEVEYVTYTKPDPPYRFTDIGGWIDIATNDKITQRLLYQDESHYNYNAIQYKDKTKKDFMSTYFAFNFYLIEDENDRKDCVYRVLTGFGMTGGVLVKPYNNNEKIKPIMPGEEINFRLIVTNTGKREDTMTLSVTKNTKYSDWNAWFEINGVRKNTVKIAGLSDYNKVYLHVEMPEFEDSDDFSDPNNVAGKLVGFTINAVSGNTALDNSTKVYGRIGAIGNITLTADDTEETIDVEDTAEFPLRLLNETNGADDVDVRLSFKGDGSKLAQFSVRNSPKTTPEIVVTLKPNTENFDVKLLVKAGEHSLYGYHNVTVEVKDDENTLLDWVDLAVKVNQFYKVKCTTDGDLDEGEVNFTLDPNNYTNDAEEIDGKEYIKKSFIANVLNFGNGFDRITLDYEENDESEDTSDWLFEIVSPDDTDEELESVRVGYYDENIIPNYGEEEVQFDVYIPIDVEEGTYIVDFFIESSNIEALTLGVDEDENNRVSFKFDIILPNLLFAPIQTDTNADNFEFWDYFENLRIPRDYLQNDEFYIEKKHSDFDDLSIEFKVAIDNNGDNEIDLEPSNIWLNITHENEFGDTIYDANLTPTYPTSSKLIAAGDNETFTFLWESFDILQEQNTIVDYTFEIKVDPKHEIYEIYEDDNSNKVQLTINHLKKKKSGGSSTPGFEALLVIAAISIVMIGLYDHRRRNR